MTDLVTFGETMLRLSPPDAERVESTRSFEVRAAGAESNVAIAAQRLGADSRWISKLPASPLGRRVVNELHWHGIDTDVVWSDEGRQGTYFLEQAGEPRGAEVIYDRSNSAVTTATADELPTEHVERAKAFHTTGITPALSNRLAETTANLLSIAQRSGTKTVFDLNYRSKLWSPDRARAMVTKLFPAIDVLVTAERDAKNVLGFEGNAKHITHSLAAKWEFDTVVLTRGARGALAIHDGVLHEQHAFETETLDPIGTGDAFVGAFVARRLAGADVSTALSYAAATASLKRTIPGDVAAVTLEEVEEVIEREGDGSEISR